MSDLAYTTVFASDGVRLGIAERNVAGYSPVRDDSDAGGTFDTLDEASAVADAYNERLGLTKREAFDIVTSSMRTQNIRDRR